MRCILSRGGTSERVEEVLRAAGHEVAPDPTLDASPDLTLVVVDVTEPAVAAGRLADVSEVPRVVVVAQGMKGAAPFGTLLEHARVTNLLGVDQPAELDPVALDTTVQKIAASMDLFGLEPYLTPGADLEELVAEIRDSRRQELVADDIQEFAEGVGCHPRIAQAFATTAGELINNALYDAPVDAEGRHRFASLPRTTPVILDPGEEIEVRCVFDGTKLCLSVTDRFGSLDPEKMIEGLRRCFAMSPDQVKMKTGGAGIGLYQSFHAVHHLIFNVAPGKRTEVIALLRLTESYRDHSLRARSFNLFVA